MKFKISLLAKVLKRFESRAVGRGIQFSGDDDHGFFDEGRAEGFQLAVDDLKGVDRIIDIGIARVDEMHDKARAFDVAEETDA